MAELLLASPRFETADLSSITLCPLGSAPLAPTTFDALRAKLPQAMVSNSWGMTEAGPAYCIMPPDQVDKRVGSVGMPVPPVQFRIVDADGRELPPGNVGELLVQNPGREREYYRDPDATARTWRDGWLHTGDLAELDEDGFLYLRGREKDVIIRGGNNVHATDVESVLYEHPAVQEAAVAAVAHAVLGEDVGAWVVLAPGVEQTETTGDELRAFCAERLSDYKVPRSWTFLHELPRNATGKVVKRDLPGR
jgi:acyl-CoA synthetase (AMP-forming)/AMP-acid ligase II